MHPVQGRSQEFTKGDKPGGLGDGSPQRGPGAEFAPMSPSGYAPELGSMSVWPLGNISYHRTLYVTIGAMASLPTPNYALALVLDFITYSLWSNSFHLYSHTHCVRRTWCCLVHCSVDDVKSVPTCHVTPWNMHRALGSDNTFRGVCCAVVDLDIHCWVRYFKDLTTGFGTIHIKKYDTTLSTGYLPVKSREPSEGASTMEWLTSLIWCTVSSDC